MMPTIVRVADKPYRWKIGVAELKDVANVERTMPREFIDADGFHITPACRRYLSPLVRGEDYPAFRDGLPDYVRLRNAPVGYYVNVETNGFGAMSDYSAQVPPADRWAIAAYIRALQFSQRATVEDVPPDDRNELLAQPAGAGAAGGPAAEPGTPPAQGTP